MNGLTHGAALARDPDPAMRGIVANLLQPKRPTALAVKPDGIPDALKHERRWVIWRYELRQNAKGESKWTKVPYTSTTPDREAASTRPATWSSFADALRAYQLGQGDGIGFVLGDGFFGLDADDCRDPQTGRVDATTLDYYRTLNTYTEVSPSGKGLKAIGRGTKPGTHCRVKRSAVEYEVYDSGRYFTVTGHGVDQFVATVEERSTELADVYHLLFPAEQPTGAAAPAAADGALPDDELLDRAKSAKNGTKFRALWDGDVTGYTSASEADMALCRMLAFWTGKDAAQMDRLFRRSGLLREKWDERHGGDTYGALTIAKAIAATTDTYGPPVTVLDPPDDHAPVDTPVPFALVTAPGSFVSDYINYASSRTDAPKEAHELMAVGLLSALAGPTPRIPIATAVKGWRLSLWTSYIVNSTMGRKTTVLDIARDIAVSVLTEQAVVEWEGSPQGLIQRLQDRDGQASVFLRDEYSGLLQQMNRGGHMAGLQQTFIRAFDGLVLENIRTRKKNKNTGEHEDDTDRVDNPYLVKLTASTWDSFVQRASIDNVLDGFLARFIFVTGIAEPRRVPRDTDAIGAARNRLVQRAHAFADRARQINRVDASDAVLDAFWELEQDWQRRAERCSRRDAARPALQRLAEAVLKVAALLALDRDKELRPRIETPDFDAAAAMGARWLASTLRLIEALGTSSFQKDCDALLDTIKQYPDGVLRSALYSRHRRHKVREFDEILTALEEQGWIRRAQKKGDGPGRAGQVVLHGPRLVPRG
ncbi:MAG TPA: DUF3987 domain-containing protein [Vicinamibacterales bacterium]|nr:DUF3987 domain-containing protein [Vicinamibacterales bacterium]